MSAAPGRGGSGGAGGEGGEGGGGLVRFTLRLGVLFNVLFLVCLVGGIFVARRIAVDAYPNVDLDAAAIYTVWIGASPEEVDTLVTARIEEEIEGIRNVDRIVSDSRPNRSTILVKFKEDSTDAEVDRAFQDLRAALERVEDLPEDAEEPILQRQTVFEIFPLASVAVGYARPELEPTARAMARELRDLLLDVDGVAKVDDQGIREPEITILCDRARLERFDVTLEEVAALLAATNRNVPAGELATADGAEYGLKAAGNYRGARDVLDTVVRQDPGGAHVRVRDVARVAEGFEKRDVMSRFNGRAAVILPVAKDEGRNSLALVDAVKDLLADVRAKGLPEGIDVGLALDSSQIIRDRLSVLVTNLLTGVVLVFLALWAGIGIRNAMLAIIGIPFCYLVATVFMAAIGVSINAISLFAMVLVSGVIVDDALIVLENIYRLLEEKLPLREAVVRGTAQVFWPVVSSTFTTLAAFLPLLLMVGVTGEFFSIIPKVVAVTLLASVFECFLILPVHYLDFGQRIRKGLPPPDRRGLLLRLRQWGGLLPRLRQWLPRLRTWYEGVLDTTLRHRYAAAVWLLAAAVAAMALWGRLDTVLFPSDFQVFMVNMEMPAEASLDQTGEASEAVDVFLHRINRKGPFAGEIDAWSTTMGAAWTEDNFVLLAPHVAQAFVSLKQGTGTDPIAVRDYVSLEMRRIREAPADAEEERIAEGLRRFAKVDAVPQQDGPPTGKPVAVRIRCDDLDTAEEIAGEIRAFLAARPGVIDIKDNFDEGRVEYSLVLREDLAAAQGIPFARAARTLVAANDGLVVSIFKDPGGRDDADVRVRLDRSDVASTADLGSVRVRNAAGATVPLSSIARVEAARSPAGIYRYDGRRTVLVTADVEAGATTATEVNDALRRRFETPAFRARFPQASLRFGGEYEETQKSFESLGEAFYVAMLAIYMILAAQFRSYALPLVILLTIPFAFIGVVLGLFVTGNPFTIMAGIAMLGLAGIAVNDAIVLVDFINGRRAAGLPVLDAVREGCRMRARPLLLTPVTTIAGLLPMALGLSGFSKLWSPFAATICFGILFSTMLTLLVVPAGYVIVEDGKARLARRAGAKGGPGAEEGDATSSPAMP